jgi:hypothetical protein
MRDNCVLLLKCMNNNCEFSHLAYYGIITNIDKKVLMQMGFFVRHIWHLICAKKILSTPYIVATTESVFLTFKDHGNRSYGSISPGWESIPGLLKRFTNSDSGLMPQSL